MDPFTTLQNRLQPLTSHILRRESAAVAIILVKSGSQILLVERRKRSGDPWSGQMAFPGGRYEVEDGTLLRTVLRETREEVGIDLQERLVGRLPDVVPRNRPGMLVAPFISLWDERPRIQLSENELQNRFWIGLEQLRESYALRLIPQITREMESYLCEDRVVWGLTARILSDLFQLWQG